MKKIIQTLTSFLASVVLLGAVVYWAGTQRLFSLYSQFNSTVAVGVLACLGGIVLLSFGWTLVVRNWVEMSLFDGTTTFYAANFWNAITPFGQAGGQPFIAYVISARHDVSGERALVSVLATDVINSICFALSSFIGLVWAWFVLGAYPYDTLLISIVAGGLIGILLIGPILIVWAYRFVYLSAKITGRYLDRLCQKLGVNIKHVSEERFAHFVEDMYELVDYLYKEPAHTFFAGIILLLSRFVVALGVCTILIGFGSEGFYPLVLGLLPMACAGNALPLPGGAGGVEAVLVFLFVTILGTNPAISAATILLYRLVTYGGYLVIGGTLSGWLIVSLNNE